MQKVFLKWISLCLIVSMVAAPVRASEPVDHADQFATVTMLFKNAQRVLAVRKALVDGAKNLSDMLGGMGKFVSPLLEFGDLFSAGQYSLLGVSSTSATGLFGKGVNIADATAGLVTLDQMLSVNKTLDYTDEQIKAITNNQNLLASDLAVSALAQSEGIKNVTSEHGAAAVDADNIVQSVNEANNMQEIMQVLTSSDKQILSSARTLTGTEATLAVLSAAQTIKEASAVVVPPLPE